MEMQKVACRMQKRKLRTDRPNRPIPTTEEFEAIAEVDTPATVTQTVDEQPRSGASPPILPNAQPGTPRRSSNQYRPESRRLMPY